MNIIDKQKYESIKCISNMHGDFVRLFNEISNVIGKNDKFPITNFNDSVEKKPEEESMNSRFLRALTMASSRISKTKQTRKKPSNTLSHVLFIVSGNNGLISDDKDMYIKELSKYEEYLESKDSCILFMHGNEDNPRFFTYDKIQMKCIETIADYSIIKTAKHNILCIGGKISADRQWRIKHQNDMIRYFGKEEMPELNESLVSKIFSNEKIDGIITQSYPSFVGENCIDAASKWGKQDESLLYDMLKSRISMDAIYHKVILSCDYNVKWLIVDECDNAWYYHNCTFENVSYCRNMFEQDNECKSKITRKAPTSIFDRPIGVDDLHYVEPYAALDPHPVEVQAIRADDIGHNGGLLDDEFLENL